MKHFTYASGEEVKDGDQILYHGETGEVEFIVTEITGNPTRDWYVEQFRGGGIMIRAKGFGSVFLPDQEVDANLTFVARKGPS